MNRNPIKHDGRISRAFALSSINRVIVAFVISALLSAHAAAQYPGGGGSPSYGSKGAVIGGVAAGAAAGAALLYLTLHNRAKLQGCVAGDGDKLVNEKNQQTYSLTNEQNQSLKPGRRVELVGKRAKTSSGEPAFVVQKMTKDLGQCSVTTAAR